MKLTIDEIIQIEKHFWEKDKKALTELQNEFPMIQGITENSIHEKIAELLEELKGYRSAEEQELLLKLPCKVGSTVYITCGTKIEIEEVVEIRHYKNDKSEFIYQYLINGGYAYFEEKDIGVEVFFTYSEADKRFKEKFR